MVKFLVVRFSSIGDILLTTPVVRHLKKQVEGATVHYLTDKSFVPLLEANPHIDKVHAFDGKMKICLQELRAEGFDYIIDLHNNTRTARIKYSLKRMDFTVRNPKAFTWLYVHLGINRLSELHMADRNLETISSFISETDADGLDYFIPEGEHIPLTNLPEAYRDGYVGLVIGTQHETRKLPLQSLVELCGKLIQPVLILGGPEDRETGDAIVAGLPGKAIHNRCGKQTIHQSASLVQQARVIITHDTGLMHIAASFKKRIISVWGNTVPEFGMVPYRTDPASTGFEVSGLKCRPCSKTGYQRCPKKHFRCMQEQDLDGIAKTTEQLFSSEA